jgi:hypothetical protein
MDYLCHKWQRICSTCPKHFPVLSLFIGFVTRLDRWVRVIRSLVVCVCFVDRCLSFCPFSFGHCVVCSSPIYGFWLPPFGIFKIFLFHKRIIGTKLDLYVFIIWSGFFYLFFLHSTFKPCLCSVAMVTFHVPFTGLAGKLSTTT